MAEGEFLGFAMGSPQVAGEPPVPSARFSRATASAGQPLQPLRKSYASEGGADVLFLTPG